jgi:integrase
MTGRLPGPPRRQRCSSIRAIAAVSTLRGISLAMPGSCRPTPTPGSAISTMANASRDRSRRQHAGATVGANSSNWLIYEKTVDGARHSRVDFHSWRRWFITAARNAGVDRAVVAAVVGHEVGNLTDDTYSGGPDEKLLRACVEAVRLPGAAQA